jgi:hypothetical protein
VKGTNDMSTAGAFDVVDDNENCEGDHASKHDAEPDWYFSRSHRFSKFLPETSHGGTIAV